MAKKETLELEQQKETKIEKQEQELKDNESVNKLLSYIDNSIEFTKNCIKDNLERDIDTTNLNSQLKIYKRIKDKILYYFEISEKKETLDIEIKDQDLPF